MAQQINIAAEQLGWEAYQRLYQLLHHGNDWNHDRNAEPEPDVLPLHGTDEVAANGHAQPSRFQRAMRAIFGVG